MRHVSLLALFLAACSQTDEFAERAAWEMRCAQGSLSFVDLGKNTWGVSGCGKQSTYQRIGKNWIKVDDGKQAAN